MSRFFAFSCRPEAQGLLGAGALHPCKEEAVVHGLELPSAKPEYQGECEEPAALGQWLRRLKFQC